MHQTRPDKLNNEVSFHKRQNISPDRRDLFFFFLWWNGCLMAKLGKTLNCHLEWFLWALKAWPRATLLQLTPGVPLT